MAKRKKAGAKCKSEPNAALLPPQDNAGMTTPSPLSAATKPTAAAMRATNPRVELPPQNTKAGPLWE